MIKMRNLSVIILMMAIFVSGCVNEQAVQEEIEKDAQEFAKFRCELRIQQMEMMQDSITPEIRAKIEELKVQRDEKAKSYMDKYRDDKEKKQMFRDAVKKATKELDVCKELIEKYDLNPEEI